MHSYIHTHNDISHRSLSLLCMQMVRHHKQALKNAPAPLAMRHNSIISLQAEHGPHKERDKGRDDVPWSSVPGHFGRKGPTCRARLRKDKNVKKKRGILLRKRTSIVFRRGNKKEQKEPLLYSQTRSTIQALRPRSTNHHPSPTNQHLRYILATIHC